MITERANIIRQNRKTIKILIDENGQVSIYAPKHITNSEIEKLVGNKESWAMKKSFQIKERRENNRDIFDYNSILVCGKEYKVKDYSGKKPGLSNDYFLIPSKYGKDKYVNVIKKWLKSLSSEMIEKRLNELSNTTNLQYKSVKIGNFKAKWGSCDSSKNIKINYKVVMLPHKIIDAVLLHELVHTKVMNHSQAFYKKLIAIMPEYKKYRAVLKNYGFLLKLY